MYSRVANSGSELGVVGAARRDKGLPSGAGSSIFWSSWNSSSAEGGAGFLPLDLVAFLTLDASSRSVFACSCAVQASFAVAMAASDSVTMDLWCRMSLEHLVRASWLPEETQVERRSCNLRSVSEDFWIFSSKGVMVLRRDSAEEEEEERVTGEVLS